MAITVDPDETAHYEPSHLDLQCLQNQLLLCLALYGLTYIDFFFINKLYHRKTSHLGMHMTMTQMSFRPIQSVTVVRSLDS